MFDEVAETDQTTLHLDAPIDCPMGLLSELHTVASTSVMCQEWQCVVGCDVIETDDVRADVYDDMEDKDWYHLSQSVAERVLPDNRTRHSEADVDSTNVASFS